MFHETQKILHETEMMLMGQKGKNAGRLAATIALPLAISNQIHKRHSTRLGIKLLPERLIEKVRSECFKA